MVERLLCKQDAAGSSPAGSTRLSVRPPGARVGRGGLGASGSRYQGWTLPAPGARGGPLPRPGSGAGA